MLRPFLKRNLEVSASAAAHKQQDNPDTAVISAASISKAIAITAAAAQQQQNPDDRTAGISSEKTIVSSASAIVVASASTVCCANVAHVWFLQINLLTLHHMEKKKKCYRINKKFFEIGIMWWRWPGIPDRYSMLRIPIPDWGRSGNHPAGRLGLTDFLIHNLCKTWEGIDAVPIPLKEQLPLL